MKKILFVFALLIAPFMALAYLGPPAGVVSGDAIRASDADYLREAGLLLEGEEVLYFYSSGFFSMRGEGVFVSNLGVTSYWTDLDAEDLSVAFLPYSEIVDIEVTYGGSIKRRGVLWPTVVRVEGLGEENWFEFELTATSGTKPDSDRRGDRLFLAEVERRWTDASLR